MFGRKKKTESPYPPIDIAYKVVKTRKGMKQVLTTADERKQMRKDIKRKNPNLEVIESAPPAKKDALAWIDELEMLDAIFDD